MLIEGYLILFVHQLSFWLLAEINIASIEHYYIKIFKVSVFQAMEISTVGKPWYYNEDLPKS